MSHCSARNSARLYLRGPIYWGYPTMMLSRLGPPFAVVAVARMVLLPALRFTVVVTVTQLAQSPVPAKDRLATVVPLTMMFIGRFTAVPLANRTRSAVGPAWVTFTVKCTKDPV